MTPRRDTEMKRGDIFPSRFFKASDLNGKSLALVIQTVRPEILKSPKGDETKPIVAFDGFEKELVLNRTNFDQLVDICGSDDSDNWAGCPIELYPAKTSMGSKVVDCI